MVKSNSKKEEGKERRFSQEQYDMLKRCSLHGNIGDWNQWRKKNPSVDIELEGARLGECYLKGVHLDQKGVEFLNEGGTTDTSRKGYSDVYLKGAHLNHTRLEGARLMGADLEGAKLWFANLEGADIADARLGGAECQRATVDGSTSLWECKVNRKTNFLGVNLDVVKIDPATKQLLEYNIRQMNWEEWYNKGVWWQRILKRLFIQPFWWMSDYGMSTLRVVGVFFLLAFLFAAVYVNWAYWQPPGIVSNLVVQPEIGETVLHYFGRALIRPVYFSVVTMTTLGFGDMYANKGSIAGHVLLILQVILGYVLLGALVTRFAVLFTAGGPAGKFAEEKKK